MKKQFFTFTICLALTATSALAQITTQKIQPVPGQKLTAPGSKPTVTTAPSAQRTISKEEAKKRFEAKKAQERERLYETLKLTKEQRAEAQALDAKTKAEGCKYLNKVRVEAQKLKEMKEKNAPALAVHKQKLALREAKLQARNHFKTSRKSFEAILTEEQKVQYKAIQDAKRKEMKQFKKGYKHKHCVRKNFGARHELIDTPSGGKSPHGQRPQGCPPADKK